MVIIAKHAVELGGHIYRKGEACKDFTGDITDRIVANFVGADGKPLTVAASGDKKPEGEKPPKVPKNENAAKIAKTVEVMGRDGIMQALDGMSITYAPKAKTEYLAKLLLINKGELIEE